MGEKRELRLRKSSGSEDNKKIGRVSRGTIEFMERRRLGGIAGVANIGLLRPSQASTLAKYFVDLSIADLTEERCWKKRTQRGFPKIGTFP